MVNLYLIIKAIRLLWFVRLIFTVLTPHQTSYYGQTATYRFVLFFSSSLLPERPPSSSTEHTPGGERGGTETPCSAEGRIAGPLPLRPPLALPTTPPSQRHLPQSRLPISCSGTISLSRQRFSAPAACGWMCRSSTTRVQVVAEELGGRDGNGERLPETRWGFPPLGAGFDM